MTTKAKLGSGARFKALAKKVEDSYEKKGMSDMMAKKIGAATAAKMGRAKHGAAKMAAMAAAGRKKKK